MSEAIFVEGLTKTYAGKTVVDHLDLSAKSGTVFGLLGANGAGKSTTIECMLGTKQPDIHFWSSPSELSARSQSARADSWVCRWPYPVCGR